MKQDLCRGAKKKIHAEYQDSILANKKAVEETTLKVGLDEFRATNDIEYCYATTDKLFTPTNDIRQALLGLASQSNSFDIKCSLTND